MKNNSHSISSCWCGLNGLVNLRITYILYGVTRNVMQRISCIDCFLYLLKPLEQGLSIVYLWILLLFLIAF